MTKILNITEFINKAHKKHNNYYDYNLVNYVNSRTKIKIICPIHGVFEQKPNNHLNGQGCLECGKIKSKNKNRKNNSYFIGKAIKIHGNKYDYSKVNYIGADNYVDIICPIHGVFSQHANSHLSGRNCPKCVGGIKKTKNEFILNAKKIHKDKYDYSLVEYVNAKTNVNIICSIHGIFKQTPSKHLCGHGCTICNESKGEKEISDYLLNKSINFEREKKFIDCKGKRHMLSFDFYLPEYKTLIEFDGKQHYIPVNFYGCSNEKALKTFFDLKKNDEIKNNFTKLNNYNLLRIKFDQINKIKKILEIYEPISQR